MTANIYYKQVVIPTHAFVKFSVSVAKDASTVELNAAAVAALSANKLNHSKAIPNRNAVFTPAAEVTGWAVDVPLNDALIFASGTTNSIYTTQKKLIFARITRPVSDAEGLLVSLLHKDDAGAEVAYVATEAVTLDVVARLLLNSSEVTATMHATERETATIMTASVVEREEWLTIATKNEFPELAAEATGKVVVSIGGVSYHSSDPTPFFQVDATNKKLLVWLRPLSSTDQNTFDLFVGETVRVSY